MAKTEAKWNTILNQYLRDRKLYCYYELKQTKSDNFLFDKIEEHQIEGLRAAENNGFVWKLSDEDQRQKPFDGFSTPPLPAYLVIKYPSGFYFIRFREIEMLMETGYRGIIEEYAGDLAQFIIRLELKKNDSKKTRKNDTTK